MSSWPCDSKTPLSKTTYNVPTRCQCLLADQETSILSGAHSRVAAPPLSDTPKCSAGTENPLFLNSLFEGADAKFHSHPHPSNKNVNVLFLQKGHSLNHTTTKIRKLSLACPCHLILRPHRGLSKCPTEVPNPDGIPDHALTLVARPRLHSRAFLSPRLDFCDLDTSEGYRPVVVQNAPCRVWLLFVIGFRSCASLGKTAEAALCSAPCMLSGGASFRFVPWGCPGEMSCCVCDWEYPILIYCYDYHYFSPHCIY